MATTGRGVRRRLRNETADALLELARTDRTAYDAVMLVVRAMADKRADSR